MCVMLCFVWVLVFCCVAGGQELGDWSNNTSLKDDRLGNYSGMDRSERCKPFSGAPFVGIWVPVVFGTCVSISCSILALAHVLLSRAHKYLSQASPTLWTCISHCLWHMFICLKTYMFGTCVSLMKHCLAHESFSCHIICLIHMSHIKHTLAHTLSRSTGFGTCLSHETLALAHVCLMKHCLWHMCPCLMAHIP